MENQEKIHRMPLMMPNQGVRDVTHVNLGGKKRNKSQSRSRKDPYLGVAPSSLTHEQRDGWTEDQPLGPSVTGT